MRAVGKAAEGVSGTARRVALGATAGANFPSLPQRRAGVGRAKTNGVRVVRNRDGVNSDGVEYRRTGQELKFFSSAK